MAVSKDMAIYVKDLLMEEEMNGARLISGEEGLDNEIKGVTIIEAPDIVKWINGGEVLLTGLYAFRSCSMEDFKNYIDELVKKKISALILKRGKPVEGAEDKVEYLIQFSRKHTIPILEVPFEISFRDVMSRLMERLFNEEVTRLKYFKTTHDNFSALVLGSESIGVAIDQILDVLAKLIRNPVAAFNRQLDCIGASEGAERSLEIQKDAQSYEPGIYSNYEYLRQQIDNRQQYIVKVKLNLRERLYLVITEEEDSFDVMDAIATESAIWALQFELVRQYSVTELEKKFQNDIMHNILNGKIDSISELQKNTSLLGVPINGSFRVIVFGLKGEDRDKRDFKSKISDTHLLSDAIACQMTNVKIYNDLDRIVVVKEVNKEQTQEEYRQEIREIVDKVQAYVSRQDKELQVKAGVGKVVEGVINLPDSFKEANEAFTFVDIAGEISEDGNSQVTLFSDLGIFKLLCQLDNPELLLEYVPEGLQKLYNYKKPQRDDLLITLKTYLDRNLNLSKTAQDLFVHYKTASYRIEKIAKITGVDFDNANEVLAFRIGLVVYKMIEKYNKDYL
ncbi:PucR family transcriptional regulator [Merdimonas faecis]|uniref:PucR family transcriptional regulator ligand-binding domain-containing protein n=1 Tax=Merdimonas faecis TaxID=1653435 RepID=A0A9D2VZF1_9FIRM|nr:PucR family transcriptional regulator ligand-binding domain-containing protein [Merdimonas faecis]HJH50992.1 PucR family transcriptional regulator ligand-binding domain-containing protein [Merdimonas faecis]